MIFWIELHLKIEKVEQFISKFFGHFWSLSAHFWSDIFGLWSDIVENCLKNLIKGGLFGQIFGHLASFVNEIDH